MTRRDENDLFRKEKQIVKKHTEQDKKWSALQKINFKHSFNMRLYFMFKKV